MLQAEVSKGGDKSTSPATSTHLVEPFAVPVPCSGSLERQNGCHPLVPSHVSLETAALIVCELLWLEARRESLGRLIYSYLFATISECIFPSLPLMPLSESRPHKRLPPKRGRSIAHTRSISVLFLDSRMQSVAQHVQCSTLRQNHLVFRINESLASSRAGTTWQRPKHLRSSVLVPFCCDRWGIG